MLVHAVQSCVLITNIAIATFLFSDGLSEMWNNENLNVFCLDNFEYVLFCLKC
jgi:hypothetical protein